jgi:superkiller protein 3
LWDTRVLLTLGRNHDAITTSLATAYIYYQTPKHHEKAKSLFEGVLKRNNSQENALVGLGLVLEEQQDYRGASDLLKRALVNHPGDVKIIAEAAWCEVLQGRRAEGREELERCLRIITGVDPRSRDLKARILWRIGTAVWDMNGENSL